MDGMTGPVRTGAQGVAEVIARNDSAIVFGMPGGNTMSVFDGLRDRAEHVECVLVREESLGTMMAEAYGRLAGRPAVVMGQGAWILSVGGIGLIEAQLGASPVVALLDLSEGGTLSHHGVYQSGGGGYGSYELTEAVRAVTKRTFVAEDPVQAVQLTQLAFKHAVTGEPGPVAVVFHSRALAGPLEAPDLERIYFDRGYASPVPVASEASIELAASALRGATAPVVIAGNGCRRAEAALEAFATQLGVPVVTTPAGKGIIPETHPLSLGSMGTFGQDAANALVARADLIVAVGTKLSASDTLDESPT